VEVGVETIPARSPTFSSSGRARIGSLSKEDRGAPVLTPHELSFFVSFIRSYGQVGTLWSLFWKRQSLSNCTVLPLVSPPIVPSILPFSSSTFFEYISRTPLVFSLLAPHVLKNNNKTAQAMFSPPGKPLSPFLGFITGWNFF